MSLRVYALELGGRMKVEVHASDEMLYIYIEREIIYVYLYSSVQLESKKMS